MNKKVFSKQQKIIIASWILLTLVGGGYLRYYNYLWFEDIADTLLQISIPLMGFVLITISITGSVLGSPLVERLRQTNAYYSLMTNLYWLLLFLFFGSIVGIVLRLINYGNTQTFLLIDVLILVLITVILVLFWYVFTRFLRMMRAIKNK